MSKFTQIIDDITNTNVPLSQTTLKVKVLAYELKSRKFKAWIEQELSGYSDKQEVPEYRLLPVALFGTYLGPFGSVVRNQKLSSNGFPKGWEEASFWLSKHAVKTNLGEIEHLATSEAESFDIPFSPEIIQAFNQFSSFQLQYMQLADGRKVVARSSFVGILHEIRNRLLDFLLKLKDQFPDLQNDNATSVTEEAVEQVMQGSVFKDCTIIIGNNATIHNAFGESSTKLAEELEALRKEMRKEATDTEQDRAIADVGDAIESAKKDDAKGTMASLKKAGKWTLGMAEKIGAAIAAKAIEKSMGL